MERGGARLAQLYGLVGAIVLACYFLPSPLRGNVWIYAVAGLSTVLAIVVGLARYRPAARLPWVLFAVAQVSFAAGDLCYELLPLGFPSPADLFYLGYYPLVTVGLLLLIRHRTPGRGPAGLLDSTILAIGVGLLAWLYVIEPYSRDTTETELSRLVSMSYPVMDVILLGVTARLMIGARGRSPALVLMATSIILLTGADIVYAAVEADGSYVSGGWLDAAWMVSYFLWGAAALHPSMCRLSDRVADPGGALSGRRLILMASATLVPPATLLANSLWPVDGFDIPMAAVCAATLFVLVLGRMFGLVADLRAAVRRLERAERRERILRRAVTALTSAPDRKRIRRAGVQGARALLRGIEADVTIRLGTDRPSMSGPGVLLLPLAAQDRIYGWMSVSMGSPVPEDVLDGLRTLAAQVALALESAALAADLSRQRSDARVGALVQNSSDMILVVGQDLRISYVTPSVAVNLGHRAEELVGAPATLLAREEDKDSVVDFYTRLFRRPGKSITVEWSIRRADGTAVEIEAVCTNLVHDPGVRGVVVTAHDITERKALAAGLERQIDELEELDRIKSEFVATVSHELRTPLTSINGEVEVLLDGDRGELTPCQYDGVDAIRRSGERLLLLIEDLLTLSQIENRELRLFRTPTAVSTLLAGAIAQIGPTAAAKQLDLSWECSPELGSVMVDPEQVDRALTNLLTNAVKFTLPGGQVRVSARPDGGDVLVSIADTGVGIPVEEQHRLFTRFFRSSVATRMAIQGTGLGLVIVKRIVEQHGGSVAVTSAPDSGTTVTVRMPAGRVDGSRADAA